MATTVQKWGNSLGVRIPKALAEQADLTEGTEVEVEATDGGLTIRPRRKQRRRYKLSELLAQVKPQHRHGEIHKGGPRGRELI
jgi:antitoxin MazE